VNTKLHNLAVAHFNEPIISFEEVVRLIGYAEDERDCYFITQRMHGEIRWNTCVGGTGACSPKRVGCRWCLG
jgi:hypothetical protein